MIRLELLTPQPDLVASDTYNKLVHHARDHHDLPVFNPFRASNPRQLSHLDYGWRQRPGVPKTEPAQLVSARERRDTYVNVA